MYFRSLFNAKKRKPIKKILCYSKYLVQMNRNISTLLLTILIPGDWQAMFLKRSGCIFFISCRPPRKGRGTAAFISFLYL